MKATEKTFNGLRISGFIALFLLLALSGLCCYLIADTNETWSVITGIVGQLPFKVAEHQALHGKNFGIGLGGADELGQPVGLGKGIVVEHDHILALGPGNALIHGVGEAGVGAVFDQGEVGAAAVAAGLLQTFIGGTVVHDDELKILLCLGIDRLDGVLEPAFAVDVGDDDGCFHI